MSFHLHIGFDFWGAGNLGDDLMLAGFLEFIRKQRVDCRVSALCAHDIEAMRLRFPSIEWFRSDPASRQAALHGADAWLGLGGGVFQVEVGPWILDQMLEAVRSAKARGIPAHLVGVGVNNAAAIHAQQSGEIHRLVDRIWLRDAECLRLALEGRFSTEKALLGADTAHLYCAAVGLRARRPEAALVIHADEAAVAQADLGPLAEQGGPPWRWVCQEYRELQDAEARIYGLFPEEVRRRMPLVRPDYARGTVEELHDAVASWDAVLSCRFHTCVAAAWSGARLAVFERNQKLEAVRADLDAERCLRIDDASEWRRSLRDARPVAEARLQACLGRAHAMLGTYFSSLGLLPAQDLAATRGEGAARCPASATDATTTPNHVLSS